MSALPSMMQAKKAKLLQVALPALDTKQPPAPNQQKPVEEGLPAFTDAELKQFSVEPESAPAPAEATSAPSPAPAPATVVVASPAPAPATLSPEENEWKWKYTSMLGTNEALTNENKAMRSSLLELEQKVAELSKSVATKPVPAIELPNLTEEEQATYAQSLPTIEKIATRQAHSLIESMVKPLQAKIIELEQANQNVAKQVTTESEGVFLQQVKRNVKGMDLITSTPEWKAFINQPVSPYDTKTIAQALWQAHKSRDLDRVTAIFEGFEKSRAPVTTVADAFRGPPVSNAAGALPDAKKPMLKISERENVSKKFRKNQISLAEYQRIKQLYAEAEAEGRIDYTK